MIDDLVNETNLVSTQPIFSQKVRKSLFGCFSVQADDLSYQRSKWLIRTVDIPESVFLARAVIAE